MSIPETTSAESFERYVGGKVLFESRGEACRDVKAWIVALPAVVDSLHLPSVSEPYVAWTLSGEVDFQERENKHRAQNYITTQSLKATGQLTQKRKL